VEYILVKFDDDAKTAKLSLRAMEILRILNEKETEDPELSEAEKREYLKVLLGDEENESLVSSDSEDDEWLPADNLDLEVSDNEQESDYEAEFQEDVGSDEESVNEEAAEEENERESESEEENEDEAAATSQNFRTFLRSEGHVPAIDWRFETSTIDRGA
ncbi:hypothetical protein G5I_01488, partial [Acromyrmex echinatior]